ncbi:MAG: hypothetical protein ACI3YU_10650 [Segatella copri]
MQYTLGEYELGQIKALLPQLDELYSEPVAAKLRQLIMDAISNGFLTDKEIYELLEYLPQIVPEVKEEVIPDPDQSDRNEDWPDWNIAADAKKRRLYLQLQQRLAHLLFMQGAVHKVVAKRGQAQVNKMINQIL